MRPPRQRLRLRSLGNLCLAQGSTHGAPFHGPHAVFVPVWRGQPEGIVLIVCAMSLTSPVTGRTLKELFVALEASLVLSG